MEEDWEEMNLVDFEDDLELGSLVDEDESEIVENPKNGEEPHKQHSTARAPSASAAASMGSLADPFMGSTLLNLWSKKLPVRCDQVFDCASYFSEPQCGLAGPDAQANAIAPVELGETDTDGEFNQIAFAEPEPKPSTSTGSSSSRRKSKVVPRVIDEPPPAAEFVEDEVMEVEEVDVETVPTIPIPKKAGQKSKAGPGTSPKVPRVKKYVKTTKLHQQDPKVNPRAAAAIYQEKRRATINYRLNSLAQSHQNLLEYIPKVEKERDELKREYNKLAGVVLGVLNKKHVLIWNPDMPGTGLIVSIVQHGDKVNAEPHPESSASVLVAESSNGTN